MGGFLDWSATPASNASVGAVNWNEGQLPSTVNNSARQVMADLADVRDGNVPMLDTMLFADPVDTTKRFRFDGGSVSAGSTRVITVPNQNISLIGTDTANAFTKTQSWAKGADVSAAATVTLGSDGNYFDIIGSATIGGITSIGPGTIVKLHFDAPCKLLNGADFVIPGGADYTTAAGDEIELTQYSAGGYRVTGAALADGGSFVGSDKYVAHTTVADAAVATGSTTIPGDDSIPQSGEGNQYLSVTHTPASATNKLMISGVVMVSNANVNTMIAALFKDSDTDALGAWPQVAPSATSPVLIPFFYEMTAGTTSAITFKLRVGGTAAGTTTFNGSGGGRLFGGVSGSHITVTEVKP